MLVNVEILKTQLGGIQGKINFATVQPFVKMAEREFRTIVGRELFDFLNEASFDGAPEVDRVRLEELLEITQGCISWAAYDLALPHLKIKVGDAGLAKNSASNTVAVSKWEYADTRDANMAMVDLLWEMFWESLEETKPAVWVSSAAYQKRNEYFLRSADELTDYISLVGKNRRFFEKLQQHIRKSEDEYIAEVITPGVFQSLKLRWKDKNAVLTPVESMLVEKIRQALAYLTLYEAYPYLPIKVDHNGLREVRKWDGITNETIAEKEYRNAQRQQLWQDGQLYLGKLRRFMDANSSPIQFAEYYNANQDTDIEEDFTNKSHILI